MDLRSLALGATLALAACAAQSPTERFATTTTLLGANPTEDERSIGQVFAWLAAVGGLVAPTAGFAIGLRTRQQAVALPFAILLLISLSGVIIVVLIT